MRTTLLIFIAVALFAAQGGAAPGLTALQAVKLLPNDAPARLARIEAFEGDPAPERWHILVHDSKEPNGLHEYVVANGEVVASRAVSQFAEELKEDDIIGGDAIKVDSDRAATIAKQFAAANKVVLGSCNYELKKDGEDAVPLWRVTCLDPKGEEFGQISISATKGSVVRHEGFASVPIIAMDKAQLAAAEAQYKKDVTAYRAKKAQQQTHRVMRAEPAREQKPGLLNRIFGGGR
jgi:hypothetical protein